jgi:hypothetical protein
MLRSSKARACGTYVAERRVLEIQTKLHRWARDDPHRRFDDLFNLVADPASPMVAWDRVRGNRGAKTAGVDGVTASSVASGTGVEEFLDALRSSIKDRSFRLLPVRERMIPKAGGKLRRLGIATITDLGLVRGRPRPGLGTRMRPSTGWNCGLSPRCPAVTTSASIRCRCSMARCSFEVSPPRERPSP